jgi:hypothetical protein
MILISIWNLKEFGNLKLKSWLFEEFNYLIWLDNKMLNWNWSSVWIMNKFGNLNWFWKQKLNWKKVNSAKNLNVKRLSNIWWWLKVHKWFQFQFGIWKSLAIWSWRLGYLKSSIIWFDLIHNVEFKLKFGLDN